MFHANLSCITLAAMLVSSGAAQAQSTVLTLVGDGTFNTNFLTKFTTSFCGGATPQHYAAPASEGGVNVRAVRCGNAPGKIFSIDSDGGGWRAAAVKNSTVFNAAITGLDPTVKKVRYLDLSSCASTVGGATSSAAVTCIPTVGLAAKLIGSSSSNASLLTAPTDVDLGFSETDPALFDGLGGVDLGNANNLPSGGISTWIRIAGATGTGGTVTPQGPLIGIVLGVAASRALIEEMMVDQGITVSARPECYNTDGTANLAPAAGRLCAPVISRDQYRSLTTYTFNALNFNRDSLLRSGSFSNLNPVEVERLAAGSGAQVFANAYFQGVGCSPFYYVPADKIDPNIFENNSARDVLAQLSAPGTLRIGIVSRTNVPSATPAAGSATQNWGYLKLAEGAEKGAIGGINGGYPDQLAAARGLYDLWFEGGYLFKKSNETNADANTLAASASSIITVSDGTLSLSAVPPGGATTRGTGTGNVLNGTYYQRAGLSGFCNGPLHF